MTTTLNALAAGLIGAAALIGAAIAAPGAQSTSNADQTGSIATPVSTSGDRVYCYNGVTGSDQSRGWICQRETGSANR